MNIPAQPDGRFLTGMNVAFFIKFMDQKPKSPEVEPHRESPEITPIPSPAIQPERERGRPEIYPKKEEPEIQPLQPEREIEPQKSPEVEPPG
jgi:hypothetical protein